MPKVLIIVEPIDKLSTPFAMSSTTVRGVSTFKQAVLDGALVKLPLQGVAQPMSAAPQSRMESANSVEVVFSLELAEHSQFSDPASDYLICPLTLNLPSWIPFPAQSVFAACRDVEGLRRTVAHWQYETGVGDRWLPIVLTARGPLYAEVIGRPNALDQQAAMLSEPYIQPIHLVDSWRQPLYELGHRLLRSLAAPPAVYLMQFGLGKQGIYFDRLIPFPDAPAIASIGLQHPNLFACHWYCLTGQPIRDLLITQSC